MPHWQICFACFKQKLKTRHNNFTSQVNASRFNILYLFMQENKTKDPTKIFFLQCTHEMLGRTITIHFGVLYMEDGQSYRFGTTMVSE